MNRWSEFTSTLYDEVKKYLGRNHIASFTDLSIEEREHLIDDIERGLAASPQYHNFGNSLNLILEMRLAEVVSDEAPLIPDNAAQPNSPSGNNNTTNVPNSDPNDTEVNDAVTAAAGRDNDFEKTYSQSMLDRLVDSASGAAVAILESFDDVREELKMLFNTRLPTGLRRFLWRVKLRNDVHHIRYAEIFSTEHKATVSAADTEISRVSCGGLLVLITNSDRIYIMLMSFRCAQPLLTQNFRTWVSIQCL